MFFVLFFMLFLQKANAQHDAYQHVADSSSITKPDSVKLFQKIKAGIIFGSYGQFHFEEVDHEQPFGLHETRLVNVGIVTPKSYHELMYNMSSNGYVILNGWFFGKKIQSKDKSHFERLWDVYVGYSKEFNSHHKHLVVGVEKKFTLGDVGAFPFVEIGTDLEGRSSTLLGVLVSYQFTLYKRAH